MDDSLQQSMPPPPPLQQSPPPSLLQRLLARKIVRFGLVSVVATVADFGVYLPLCKVFPDLPLYISIAVTLGYLAGTVVHFYLTRLLVFKPTKFHIGVEFTLVFIVALIAWGLTEGIVLALHTGSPRMKTFPAKVVATVIVFFWNYLARRYLIYRDRATEPESAP